ncbi:GNAT family protein [Sphingomonas sp.]|jgi:RimJ/RimL family protein N-acetyltransferase|uniref:GNAT family N-acetyltransferase n=1 Tax=Sphingomonas sp. TaxID=28214 RepID=UPI002DF00028|nr:GNAT family protein [Sphingomonas sp.]
MIEIKTARLRLRPASMDDVEAFHSILSDPEAMAFWSSPPHTDMSETAAWVSAMMSIDPGEGEDFVIEQDGRVIGKAGLYRFPEIGFILHPSTWGQGFAREALKPVLDRAFSVHGLPAVEADVDPRNSASLRFLTRLGFVETGRASRTWNIGGHWCDSVYLRLDKSEFADIPLPTPLI